jgi:integrase
MVECRMQRGTIFKQHSSWTLLYYDTQYRNGKKKHVRVSKKLAVISKEYPTKSSVRQLADEILAPLNRKQLQPESSLKITEYIEGHYFPSVEPELRRSTFAGYKNMYEAHLKKRLKTVRLRDFRTVHGQQLLRDISVGHRTLLHIKSFISGVFRHAKQNGVLDSLNPMVDVTVPKRRADEKKFKGVAYSIEDAERMIEDLEGDALRGGDPVKLETAGDVIALLSFTGLRQSEARGLRWQDWDEIAQTLMVSRAVWNTHVSGTKNTASENTIPVLPLLRDLLLRRRARVKPSPNDYIFAGERRGTPLNFHNLQQRVIKPAFKRAMTGADVVKWVGFHGFRRGLASNLFSLGVNPKVIAGILRHSDISTTLEFYIKTPDSEAREAMDKLEARIRNAPSGLSIGGQKVV